MKNSLPMNQVLIVVLEYMYFDGSIIVRTRVFEVKYTGKVVLQLCLKCGAGMDSGRGTHLIGLLRL